MFNEQEMLSSKNTLLSCNIDNSNRHIYRTHMCGLCHGLGDEYGLPFRLLANHETITLNLITSSQLEDIGKVAIRRCPLNPFYHVQTNLGISCRFATAVSIALYKASIEDDIYDARGRNFFAKVINNKISKPFSHAIEILDNLGFGTYDFIQLSSNQVKSESDPGKDSSEPTSKMCEKIFNFSALITGLPQNLIPLASVGGSIGSYLYLRDAFCDLPKDISQKNYNPLLVFLKENNEEYFILSKEGLNWLVERVKRYHSNIAYSLRKIKFYRYHSLIKAAITHPIERFFNEIKSLHGLNRDIHFKKLKYLDALKAGLFLAPEKVYLAEYKKDDIIDLGPCGSTVPHRGYHGCDQDPCTNKQVIKDSKHPLNHGYVAKKKDPFNPCDTKYKVERKAGPCD